MTLFVFVARLTSRDEITTDRRSASPTDIRGRKQKDKKDKINRKNTSVNIVVDGVNASAPGSPVTSVKNSSHRSAKRGNHASSSRSNKSRTKHR